jgi:hypothetical protein
VWQQAHGQILCDGPLYEPVTSTDFWSSKLSRFTQQWHDFGERDDRNPYHERIHDGIFRMQPFFERVTEVLKSALDRAPGTRAVWSLSRDLVWVLKVEALGYSAEGRFLPSKLKTEDQTEAFRQLMPAYPVQDAVAWHASNLASDDERVRRAAAEALVRFGTEASSAVPALQAALELTKPLPPIHLPWAGKDEREKQIRQSHADARAPIESAIEALGQIGPQAQTAFSKLCQLAEERDYSYRRKAISAMKRIDPDATARWIKQREERQEEEQRRRRLQERRQREEAEDEGRKKRAEYDARKDDAMPDWDFG